MRLIGLAVVVVLALTFAAFDAEAADPDSSESSPRAALSPLVTWPLRVIGGLLVMYGIFAVPGDQKKYESYLVRWWVWVEERREAGLKWQTAFLQVVVTVIGNVFDRFFGDRLLSRRAAIVSVTLSLASMYLASGLFSLALVLAAGEPGELLWGVSVVFALGLLALWLVARGSLKAMIAFIATQIGYVIYLGLQPRSASISENFVWFAPSVGIALLVSLLSDILFIAATRWILRISASSTSTTHISGLIIVNVLAAVTLVGVPLVGVPLFVVAVSSEPLREGSVVLVRYVSWLIALCNVLDSVVALATVMLGA